MGDACLRVRGLKRLHLGPLDIDLAAGEIVCLRGESGAGKTVLMRAIADLDPNEGELRLETQRRETMAPPLWRRRVCYLPADSGWWAETVGEHFPENDQTAPLLKRLRLPHDVLSWPVRRLSTGEKQRLALARVLLLAPTVMLLDEPTSGLDSTATEAAEAEIRKHAENGAAVLLVSHDDAQARRLTRRTLTLSDGQVYESAP
jgi:phosphate-transporting ATPase